jgi:hypothetical protein
MSTGYMRWGTWAAVSTVDAAPSAIADAEAGVSHVAQEMEDIAFPEDCQSDFTLTEVDAVPDVLVAAVVKTAAVKR